MGFSIGGLVSGAARAAASVARTAGGPVGTILAGGLEGAFPTATSIGPLAMAGGPVVSRVGPAIRFGLGAGAAGVTISDILRRARENTGRPVSSRIIRDSVRVCGIETTASTFGLTTTEVCQVAISTGRRRARGISAADMRRTRSTIRKVTGLQKQLKALSAGRRTC